MIDTENLPPIEIQNSEERTLIVDLDALTEAQFRALVAHRFNTGTDRMDGMDALIRENTRMTKATWDNTAAIRDIVEMARSFFSGLGKFARGCARVWSVLKPIVQAAAVIAGAYVAIRSAIGTAVHLPRPPK